MQSETGLPLAVLQKIILILNIRIESKESDRRTKAWKSNGSMGQPTTCPMHFMYGNEQGFTLPDADGYDPQAVHLVIYDAEKPVATGRIFKDDGFFHPGRIAVLKDYRKKQLGRLLMEELEKIAREQDAACLRLGAQLYAVPFYERCGYRGTGERFMDEFCEHEMMEKIL